jgi:hypothetical protein
MIENPDPEPAVTGFSNGCDPAVFTTNGLIYAVEESDIAVLGSGGNNTFQREFGQFVLMRSRMIGHGVCILPEGQAPFNSPCIELGFLRSMPYDVALCCLPNERRVNESST